jgi:adenylate kinase family enzyme
MPVPARIMIIGLPGVGKTRLACRLGEQTGLPVFHSDEAFWSEGWVHNPPEIHRAMMALMVAEERWIIDGELRWASDIWMPECDLVIWLHAPAWLRALRLVWRWTRHRGVTRPGMAEGCPERLDRIPWPSLCGPVCRSETERLRKIARQLGSKVQRVRRAAEIRL